MIHLALPETQQPLLPVHLVERAREYARASKSDGTIRTYTSVWRCFTTWCESQGVTPCPATPDTIVAYVVDQAERLKPQSVKKHLAAISQAHLTAGYESPVQHQSVRLVMQGLRRTKGVASAPKKALRVEHIRKMVSIIPDTLVGIRDRAIVLVGFVAGMRRSEIVGLDVEDIAFEPEGAVLTIKKSKRDQEGKGRQVAVPFGHHEKTCPVRALRAWLAASGVTQGPIFIRLDPDGEGQRLDGRAVAHVVQRAARRAGLDPSMFAGHSLRRGFCTESARAGASESEIARTTGHTSMAVLRGYIEQGTLFTETAASKLDL